MDFKHGRETPGSSDSAAEGMDGQCYVVGMRCGFGYNYKKVIIENENKMVLMTKAVIKQLAKF